MREEELTCLVRKVQQRQTEFQTIELKAAEKGFPKRIYDTLSSFSNQDEGGTIIFGVSEKDGYDTVGVYNVEDAQKRPWKHAARWNQACARSSRKQK